MARQLNKLKAIGVAKLKTPGRHSDGGGLYLVVDEAGSKRWLFMFTMAGKSRHMGLGPLHAVPLQAAREKAAEARKLVADGIDPIAARHADQAKQDAITFGSFADQLLASLTPGFRNEKHRAQWTMTLGLYAAPLRGKLLDAITTDDVLGVLQPLWQTKPETGSRLRGRIERVLDAAKAKGLRSGENPARWRGHLALFLPKPKKLSRGHHAALPFGELPAFVAQLRESDSVGALALEFLILTAARTGEVLGAQWSEVDLDAKLWTVPAARMKAAREHRVPLTARALAILREAAKRRIGEYVFPGQVQSSVSTGRRPPENRDRPLSNMSLAMTLRRMGKGDVTPHGFRSSFRDWCGELTFFPREVAEAALAHAVGDATEQSYRRGDALEKRRLLMDAWGRFVQRTDNVVPLLVERAAT
jgi:integrase